ncbi:MAG TPA: SRPBCC domain-containing protein [Chitinophagaceae bacterium]|nr:SRPBCC domain-containing protein [Chitinophagaceae bacterium]
MRSVQAEIEIKAHPVRIIQAFLDAEDLRRWWGVARSLVQQKPGGMWVMAWDVTHSGMKYVTSGIIDTMHADGFLRVTHLVYLHPEKHILGPMELEITVQAVDQNSSIIRVEQFGYLYGGDWDWYYESVVQGWPYSLNLLKEYLERG